MIDHLPEMISLAQHQRVLAGGEKIRKGLEEEAMGYGTPSDIICFAAEVFTLLQTPRGEGGLSHAIGKLERLTGREL